MTQQSYMVTFDVLAGSLANPVASSADGYVYVPFPYLLHVEGGQIVSAEQVWTP